ncbi:hypothetical protein cyc_07775 [Cyclospora cayetanensis]|uniref:Transmembrane protein n=1 Tax=Cyclospora cayetanensis TaxID=88456 RepID=A0A1D3D420_9EIME|nr:hypothetical protein cyc_07775 [Cyclospora cayetanensis]
MQQEQRQQKQQSQRQDPCRILGFCLLSGAASAAFLQAIQRAPRTGDRYFYSFVAAGFAGLAVYRIVVPTKAIDGA